MSKHIFLGLLVAMLAGCAITQMRILNDSQITKGCESLPFKISWVGPKELVDGAKIARPVEGYKVYVKPQSDEVFREFIDVGLNDHYAFKNLEPGKKYNFKIVAYNSAGEGEATPAVSRAVCSVTKK